MVLFARFRWIESHLATLIYTSGTSGKPKGVMLSHGNLLHIITAMPAVVQPEVGDRILSILPTWHSFRSIGRLLLSYPKAVRKSIPVFETSKGICKPISPTIWGVCHACGSPSMKAFRKSFGANPRLAKN